MGDNLFDYVQVTSSFHRGQYVYTVRTGRWRGQFRTTVRRDSLNDPFRPRRTKVKGILFTHDTLSLESALRVHADLVKRKAVKPKPEVITRQRSKAPRGRGLIRG